MTFVQQFFIRAHIMQVGGCMKSTLSGFSKVDLNDKNASNKEEKGQSFAEESNINKNVYDEYNKIKNLSEQEAQARLMNEVFKQKQNGSFDFEALSRQVEGLKGYLSEKDFVNLKRMLDNLR